MRAAAAGAAAAVRCPRRGRRAARCFAVAAIAAPAPRRVASRSPRRGAAAAAGRSAAGGRGAAAARSAARARPRPAAASDAGSRGGSPRRCGQATTSASDRREGEHAGEVGPPDPAQEARRERSHDPPGARRARFAPCYPRPRSWPSPPRPTTSCSSSTRRPRTTAAQKILSDVRALIAAGGEIVNEQDWGTRPMAYEIRHQAEAEYHLLQFHPSRELLASLDRTPAHHRRRRALPHHQARARAPPTPPEPARRRPPGRRGRPTRPPTRPQPRTRQTRRPRASTLQRKTRTFRPECGWRPRAPLHSPPTPSFRVVRPRKEPPPMAATNINRVIITGNLTSDPELRSLPSGTSVCKLRVACNTRRKDNSTGEWVDKPNYFDVTVWGAQGENCGPLPLEGPSRRDRRAPRVARVGGQGRQQAPVRRHHRRRRAVPRRPRRRAGRRRRRLHAALRHPRRHGRLRRRAGRQRRRAARPRRRTTTSRSRPRRPAGPRRPRRRPASAGRRSSRRRAYRGVRTEAATMAGRAPPGARRTAQTTAQQRRNFHVAKQRISQAGPPAGQEGRGRQRPPQALPVLQGQDRAGRLQGHGDPAQVHLRARQDPLAPDHGRLPPAPEPDRDGRQARARARAAALRRRGPRRARRPRRAAGAATDRDR